MGDDRHNMTSFYFICKCEKSPSTKNQRREISSNINELTTENDGKRPYSLFF